MMKQVSYPFQGLSIKLPASIATKEWTANLESL